MLSLDKAESAVLFSKEWNPKELVPRERSGKESLEHCCRAVKEEPIVWMRVKRGKGAPRTGQLASAQELWQELPPSSITKQKKAQTADSGAPQGWQGLCELRPLP